MGLKHSSVANWSMDDLAFGTGDNAVQLEEVVDEMGQIRMKYFGGEAIQNDASALEIQRELLQIDKKIKNLLPGQRKKAQSKVAARLYEYHYQDDEFNDQSRPHYESNDQSRPYYESYKDYIENQGTTPEGDEHLRSADDVYNKQQTVITNTDKSRL